MCGTSALPVEHEGSAADMHRRFLRASARHPVCLFHTATRVGSQECHHHRLCGWHHTGEVILDGRTHYSNAAVFTLLLASQVVSGMSIKVLITTCA